MNSIGKYKDCFVKVLNVAEAELNENFLFSSVGVWDSLAHLSLISEIEDTFDVMLGTEDILHFGSFENGMRILEKYGISFEA